MLRVFRFSAIFLRTRTYVISTLVGHEIANRITPLWYSTILCRNVRTYYYLVHSLVVRAYVRTYDYVTTNGRQTKKKRATFRKTSCHLFMDPTTVPNQAQNSRLSWTDGRCYGAPIPIPDLFLLTLCLFPAAAHQRIRLHDHDEVTGKTLDQPEG